MTASFLGPSQHRSVQPAIRGVKIDGRYQLAGRVRQSLRVLVRSATRRRKPEGRKGGNYIFGRRLPNGNFLPIYVGETDNFRARLPSHERWKEAKKAGATHVMAHITPAGEAARKAEEKDLIQKWSPPLNVQHRKVV